MKAHLHFHMTLLLIAGTFCSTRAFGEETNAAVSASDLDAFMETWKPFASFTYPDDPKDQPLLLAALKKEPAGPWVEYLSLKFSFDKYEARKLGPPARAQKFRDMLGYLEPARQIVLDATQKRPADKKLQSYLRQIEQAIATATIETGGDLKKIKLPIQAQLKNSDVNIWNNANVVYDANVNLGRIALREGNIEEAKKYLIAAGKTRGSTQLNTFGPDYILARELLEKGERDVVLEFLDLVERFWTNVEERKPGDARRVAAYRLEKLESWRETIRHGKIPDDPKWK